MSRKKRLLALDGGGTWSIVQVHALAWLFGWDTKGRDILERFDVAVANSGGSLVLGGLAVNRTPRELRRIFAGGFLDEVFDKKSSFVVTSRLGFGARYRAASKLVALQKQLGTSGPTLEELGRTEHDGLRLLFVAYDYVTERAMFLRTYASKASGDPRPSRTTLAEAVHASSNAPINYFDHPASIRVDGRPRLAWDGALAGYNNPVMAGVVELIAQGAAPDGIRALSLGTSARWQPAPPEGSAPIAGIHASGDTGFRERIERAATAILAEPPTAATYTAYTVLGGPQAVPQEKPLDSPVVRLAPFIAPVRRGTGWTVPPAIAESYAHLMKLDLDATSDADLTMLQHMAGVWLTGELANQPIRVDSEGRCQLGQSSANEARAVLDHWDLRLVSPGDYVRSIDGPAPRETATAEVSFPPPGGHPG